ncbi:hypothetical protein [Devosia rhizoryzae]|uniref:Secreted protein n=1 Tax=Devosia rhizoryzae TaxID=2774137 RepID=A0ABX7C1Y1_9HYPH|nr:hypothetical protein [Devosia rhizoryzae]QQR38238.1 hypothetical protein JI748_10625 [Devosia rhizoryzae]
MELAFIFLVVVVGVGVIAYAGMHNPKTRRPSDGSDGGSSVAFDRDQSATDTSDGGGDGGGGGD